MKHLFTLLFCFSFAGAAIAQTPNQQWISVLNSGTSSVDGFNVCGFSDTYYYSKRIAVNSDDSKVGVTGISGCDNFNAILNASNGSTLLNSVYSSSGVDGGINIAPDNSGNLVSTGLVSNGSSYKGLLSKFGSSGTSFQNLVGISGNTRTVMQNLKIDAGNNIFVSGHGYTGSINNNTMYKYAPDGSLLWTNTISDFDFFYAYSGALAVDPSGNVIYSGQRQTSGSPSTYDIVIRKLDPNGNQLWQVYYNVGEDYINDMVVDAQGNIYFTMEVRGVENRLVKLDGSNGSQLWTMQYSAQGGVGGTLKINTNGNILVGYSQLKAVDQNSGNLLWSSNAQAYDFATDASSRIYTVKDNTISILNSDGTILDNLEFSIPGYTTALRFVAASANGFYVSGTRTAGSESKIFVAKYSGYSNENSLSYQLSQEKLGNCSNSPVKLSVKTSVKVKTDSAGSIGSNTATAYGNILNDGGKTITRRGFCWGTSANPTLSNSFIQTGSGSGNFSGSLSGLSPSTNYFLRAYAGTETEVWYGNEISFSTVAGSPSAATCGTPNIHNPNLSYGTMTDQDGNSYKTIVIGTQEWMAENLKSSHYQNGDLIPVVSETNAWLALTSGGTCWYKNDSASYQCPYGKLYNWYAVADPRNVCPAGWHVADQNEWNVLVKYLDSDADTNCTSCTQSNIAGGKLKSVNSNFWRSPNLAADNSTGFSALPGGDRFGLPPDANSGAFYGNGFDGVWWTSTPVNGERGYSRALTSFISGIIKIEDVKTRGEAVRCLKD